MEELINHRVGELEHNHKNMHGELHEVKQTVTSISAQTNAIKETLVEIKDALTAVAKVATDVQLTKQAVNAAQQDVIELSIKLQNVYKVIDIKETRVHKELEKKEEKLLTELKEVRKEFQEDQKWFKRLVYAALIAGAINIMIDIVKSNTVVEKQYHITNNNSDKGSK